MIGLPTPHPFRSENLFAANRRRATGQPESGELSILLTDPSGLFLSGPDAFSLFPLASGVGFDRLENGAGAQETGPWSHTRRFDGRQTRLGLVDVRMLLQQLRNRGGGVVRISFCRGSAGHKSVHE